MRVENVIYIVAHDLGRQLGLYGSCFPTPNLDRFGRGGVVFDEAYCTSTCCSPSRGCAMTGKTAHTNGLAGLANPGAEWKLPQQTRTIVDDFNDHGYETVHAGMEHERQSKHDNHYARVLESQGWVESAVDAAIGYLKGRSAGDRPFYLNLGTNEVHSGQWQTHKDDRKHNRHGEVYGSLDDARVVLPDYIPDTPAMRREWAAFGGCVRYWDEQVGRLLDYLGASPYADNTLVVVTTDHGVAAHRGKGTVYREGVEIALLARVPGGGGGADAGAGRRVDHLVQNIDFLPTMLEACGLPVRGDVEGRSFWGLLSGGAYEANDAICLERNFHGGSFDPMRTVRTADYALIRNFAPEARLALTPDKVAQTAETYEKWYVEMWPKPTAPRPEYELFDRRRDPGELRNVAGDPAYASVLRELDGRLTRWMQATADPILEARDADGFKRVLRGHVPGALAG